MKKNISLNIKVNFKASLRLLVCFAVKLTLCIKIKHNNHFQPTHSSLALLMAG